jgi:hypothetical protein
MTRASESHEDRIMKLEEVLERWVRDQAGRHAPHDESMVAGRWTNEYGSVADLRLDGARVGGTFTSAPEATGRSLTGEVTGWATGDIVSFSVHWPGGAPSITSWVGQVVDEGGAPVLKTLWHMVVDIADADEASHLWATVLSGADTFR